MSKGPGVLSSLDGMLPDNRPLLSVQIVETVSKCPAGYWPVSRTYDEDSDAGLLKQQGLFGKKPTHYICISKTEGVPGYVMDGIAVVGERELLPAGYGVAGRVGKRRLCTRVSRHAAPLTPPVTDVIVCSKMRSAPQGFLKAGEINGKMVCYKVSGAADESPTHNNYENVIGNNTPDINRRLKSAPERPPKMNPILNDLSNLNLKQSATDEFTSSHDYEALNPSYNLKPTRPAPPAPSPVSNRNSFVAVSPPLSHNHEGPISPAQRHKKGPAPLPRSSNYNTLGNYNSMEGVPFLLNPKLSGLSVDIGQIPVIKHRTRADIEKEFSYDFKAERQT